MVLNWSDIYIHAKIHVFSPDFPNSREDTSGKMDTNFHSKLERYILPQNIRFYCGFSNSRNHTTGKMEMQFVKIMYPQLVFIVHDTQCELYFYINIRGCESCVGFVNMAPEHLRVLPLPLCTTDPTTPGHTRRKNELWKKIFWRNISIVLQVHSSRSFFPRCMFLSCAVA